MRTAASPRHRFTGHRRVVAAVAGVLVLGAAAPAALALDEVPPVGPAGVLAEQLEAAGIPGGAVVTTTTDGDVQARGVGTTGDGDPVTARTAFVIGSTTKSFTSLAVMQQVDAGEVDLDAPVTQYVPELRLASGEPVDEITVRHLLQHTSGLDAAAGGPILRSAVDGTALDAVAELRDSRLTSSPGETWSYANINYVLAGLVVERASGMSYADYVQQRILDPLRMTDTHVLAHPDVAPGHRYWFGFTVASGPVQRSGVVAAGYAASSARDLGRYLTMYLRDGLAADGTRVVSAEGVRTLIEPGPKAHLGPWADGGVARYAMGWMVGGPWAEQAVFHPGNAPDSSAMVALFPGRDLAAAVLVPASHEVPVPGNPSLTDRISRATLHAVLGEPVPAATSSWWSFYAIFNLVAGALVCFGVWRLVRSVGVLLRRPVNGGPVRRWLRPLPAVATAVLLVLMPSALGYGWGTAWTWAPDLAVVIGVLLALAVLTAVLRLVGALRSGSSRDRLVPVEHVRERVIAAAGSRS